MKDSVGLIGLGRMGSAIAHRLLDQGYPLVAWNRDARKAAELVERGAQLASSPTAVAQHCSTVLVIVRDDEAIRSVYFGRDGLLANRLDGRCIIEMTTATVGAVRQAANAVREAGGRFIDAPVSGTVTPARQGQLFFMAGAELEDLEGARPLLDALARKVHHVGPPGTGIVMKLVLNLPLATYWRSLGEAIALGDAYGLDVRSMLAQIVDSKAAVGALASKLPVIQGDTTLVEFDLAGLHKDMQAMQHSAAGAGLTLPGLATAVAVAERAVQQGWGERDLAALVRFVAHSPDGKELP